ncbi:MAG: helix-turn-helix transcriptional regulator [Clostridiales bacterium]|nr:helix-turn-helix transcriptional regulator [Clostridiales bacterium]
MTAFAQRLKELRTENNLTQKQVAVRLGIRQQSYTRYENGSGEPSLDTLIAIARFYNVSVDYLLGLTDY